VAKVDEVMKNVDSIEKTIRFHGMWGNPYIPPPQIQIREDWSDEVLIAAKALNKMFFIRSLPMCSRMFGPVRESQIQAFFEDYITAAEKIDYARIQANLLLADLKLIRGLDFRGLTSIGD